MNVPVLANTLCPGCNQWIGSVDHCTEEGYPFVIDGEVQWLSAIPYGDDREDWTITPPERCHDCGVKVGEVHHWGCDMAQCPNLRSAATRLRVRHAMPSRARGRGEPMTSGDTNIFPVTSLDRLPVDGARTLKNSRNAADSGLRTSISWLRDSFSRATLGLSVKTPDRSSPSPYDRRRS